MKNLTEEELKSVQEIHNKYNKAKMDLGDHVLQRRALLQNICLLYTSPSPRDKRQSRMPSSA